MQQQELEINYSHKCSYCGTLMIPAPYYGVRDGGNTRFFLLDKEITKAEFLTFSKVSDKMFGEFESLYENAITK